MKPWLWANLWPCELLGVGIPCLTFADLWSLQGPFSCKFWLWPCPCSWRFNISYAMLTGDPFPIVLMHSPMLGLCVDQSCQSPISELLSKSLSARQILLYRKIAAVSEIPQDPAPIAGLGFGWLAAGQRRGVRWDYPGGLGIWEMLQSSNMLTLQIVAVVRLNQTPIPPRPSWGHIFGTALPRFGGRFPAAVGVSEAKQEQASTDEDPVRSWATAWFSQSGWLQSVIFWR